MNEAIIHDRRGKSFRVEYDVDAVWLDFHLYDGGISIGYARCRMQALCSLRIVDLLIYDDVHFESHSRWRFWFHRHVLGCLRGYRNHGLGTAFLNFILADARQRGFKRIEGSAHPDRPEHAEALLRWYRRMGFTIKPADKTKLVTSLAELELVLA
jgi:GNAT superfamily N-acetyltransferase